MVHADIKKLDSAADAQNGFVQTDGSVQQNALHGIPGRAGGAALFAAGLPVQRRLHILAAGQQQAIALADEIQQLGLVLRQRQGMDRQASSACMYPGSIQ